MKVANLFLLLGSLTLTSPSFADPDLANLAEPLTDEMAEELGMTEATSSYINGVTKNLSATWKGIHDLNDDQVNSRISKVVLIVNEGDRHPIVNPKGQTAALYVDGILQEEYNISSGSNLTVKTTSGRRYVAKTPHGYFKPKSAYNKYYSRTFFGSDMQYAVFFKGGIATHTSGAVNKLGTRASGGCIRMKRSEAKEVNEAIIDTGENHRNKRRIRMCNNRGTKCFNRELYTNREKDYDIAQKNGDILPNKAKIWTYDATIIVKPGGR